MAQQNDSRIDVFFYGLFMDEDLLRQKDTNPKNRRFALLQDYALVIGDRATLVAKPGEQAYGVVFSLTELEIKSLYAEPSVKEYRPETVVAKLQDGKDITALCFNLPVPPEGQANAEYAAKLHELATRLNFPTTYIEKIR